MKDRAKSFGLELALLYQIHDRNDECEGEGRISQNRQAFGIRHLFTRPYRPRTNGKAERFIQTLTHKWAYGTIYGTSAERTAALPGWLTHYNYIRPHGSLSHKPPGTRLHELTNVPRNYT